MRSFTVDAGGPVHVADYGGAGQLMLLVHGLGGSHLTWSSVAPRLARRHRVLAVDLPGFGRSPIAGRRATVAANLALLGDVIGHLADGPLVLGGNSMGGLLAIGMAAQRPGLIDALLLVDPALPLPRRNWRGDPFVRGFVLAHAVPTLGRRRLTRRIGALGPERTVRDVLALCTVDAGLVDPALVDALITLETERMNGDDWHVAVYDAARSLLRILALRTHAQRWIRSVVAPTLLVHGRRDRVVPIAAAESAARSRPDWEFQVFDNVGHIPMMEVPGQFLDVVEHWLARLPGAGRAQDLRPVGSVA